ncbi:hypothetical protein J4217_01600 [Candidatus Pacearchaeota archaeon]|nr:hypothetical protein [Candidatus Pacearchaeota archaeon]
MGIKEAWHNMEKDKKTGIIVVLSVLILILIIVAVYFSYFNYKICADYGCFKDAMSNCKKMNFINEGSEATWGYTILGQSNGECIVRVKLLQAKKGTLDIEQLRGYSMDCAYSLGISKYPESDLGRCHGRLKEELQGIVIDKLYVYIVDNLGQIGDNLRSAV